jgi:hypothetical protein
MATNWTETQTGTLINMYQKGESLETLAELLQKSVASCRAKLSSEKVYKKPVKATGSKKAISGKKLELISAFETLLSQPAGELAGLDKLTIKTLEKSVAALVARSVSLESTS